MSAAEKAALRRALLQKRRELEDRREKDEAIFRRVRELPEYRRAKHLFCYVSTAGEADTGKLLEAALTEGKKVYAPVCGAAEGAMGFYRVLSPDGLKPGRWGIPEPETAEPAPPEASGKDCLLLVPGIAFDRRGYRLGYGKGYYDRFLAERELFSVGLCYGELLLDRLPAEAHDRRVDRIVTERELLLCRTERI